MSEALDKAEAAVADASRNTDVVAVAMAALEVAKLAAQNVQQQPQTCGHDHKQPEFNTRKWLTIGGLIIIAAAVASALALAFALAALAVAIAGTCATCCLLVLRRMWRDYLNNR